jgi:hypothetical protein
VSRSSKPMRWKNSVRMRSPWSKASSAPSFIGSMCTRNGRCPFGRSMTRTIWRATSQGWRTVGPNV